MSSSFKSSKQEHLSQIKKEFYNQLKAYKEEFKPAKELTTYSTLPLLTSKTYPQISTYQVTNTDIENTQFNQNEFVKKDYSHILKHKARSVVATSQPQHKTQTKKQLQEDLTLLYSSKKAVESEHIFEDELKIGNILSSKTAGLLGNSTPLLKINTYDNISISKHLEKHQQGETKAKDAIIELYERGFNDTQIRTLLSLGTFGLDKNKVLVPTKWSISACDSVLEQYLYTKIINYRIGEEYLVFEHNDKGNHFIICFLPNQFCSDVIETYTNSDNIQVVEEDFVPFSNKLSTKEPECAGGYWATKLAMLEKINSLKKQYACISIRIINNYEIPLGVIFVRESVREAINKKPIFKTLNKEEFEQFLENNYLNHFKFYKNSKFHKEISNLKHLNKWM